MAISEAHPNPGRNLRRLLERLQYVSNQFTAIVEPAEERRILGLLSRSAGSEWTGRDHGGDCRRSATAIELVIAALRDED